MIARVVFALVAYYLLRRIDYFCRLFLSIDIGLSGFYCVVSNERFVVSGSCLLQLLDWLLFVMFALSCIIFILFNALFMLCRS